MRLTYACLLFFCLLIPDILSAQTPSTNETIVATFEKILRRKRDEWSKNNFNSIIFVPDAGLKQAVVFSQLKVTSFDSIALLLTPQEKSRKFLYFSPDPVDTVIKNGEVQIKFPTGGFSYIEEKELAKNLTFKGDTIIYKTDSAKSVRYPGSYGIRIMDDKEVTRSINTRLSYAWYLPEDYEYLSYTCNKKGYWQRQGNLIHFVGDFDENNFLFDIRFRKKHAQPAILQGRKVDFTKTIQVNGDHVEVFINDAQTEDGDIISLNLNGEWIVKGLVVSKAGAKIVVPLIHKTNYLVMHAENLGSIPPNTASMQINDGTKVHQIILNSDAGKSEGILFTRP